MTTDAHKIEIWEIEKLVPYDKNAKIHSDEQVAKVARSIQKFGWTQPIVVDGDGVIIAGHGRRLAALSLGMKKVPVVARRDLSKTEADALRLADNRVASVDYDMAAIEDELQRLASEDFDMEAIGFDEHELNFSTGDIGMIDDGVFVDDISGAVEKQKEENAERAEEIDKDVAAPVADALGFKRVTLSQSRALRDLMTKVEAKTGETGAEALISFINGAI